MVVCALALASAACNRSQGSGVRPSAIGASFTAPSHASAGGHAIDFPPRNEPFDFRAQLEAKYRDGLHRTATSTFVDIEGDIVWTQEYLRYRVNSCSHAEATDRVFRQIDGAGLQPDCQPLSESNLSGTWNGTGDYPNAPFTLTLVQTGSRLRGSYRDQHDASTSVDGSLNGDFMTVNVNFGDAGLVIEGKVEDAHEVRGTMRTPSLGNRPFAFTMRR